MLVIVSRIVVSGDLKKIISFFWANANRIALFDVGSFLSTHSSAYQVIKKAGETHTLPTSDYSFFWNVFC